MQRGLPMQPTVVVLPEGTDTSQGKPQLLSDISACLAIADTLASTLGPRGMDKLIVNEKGEAQITNNGTTILKSLDIVHPAARSLVDIARAQDAEVGDGTTSVVLLAAQMLKEVRGYIEEGVSPHIITEGYREASQLAIERIKELQINIDKSNPAKFRDLLLKCASTSLSSKLIHSQKPFFSQMTVDAVLSLDQDDLDESLIGVKGIPGGGLQDSLLVKGVAFKKTFTHTSAEQQPKLFKNPLILTLNVELKLKTERDNTEVRVDRVEDSRAIVDAQWTIIYRKLELIEKTGAKVVLSKLPIGDIATQWFADRGIFCAGLVQAGDLRWVVRAVGGSIQSTCSDIQREHLGTCGLFEERQVGGERYNIFEECPGAKTCTLLLRGGAEVERSLHNTIMVVKRAVKNNQVVAGGGAIEMELSAYLRTHARTIPDKIQLIISAFAKALEIIPRQICDNAALDSTDILNCLRQRHASGQKWAGVDVDSETGVRDNMEAFVLEPSLVKLNAIASAAEAACLILSVKETVRNPQSEQPQAGPRAPPGRPVNLLALPDDVLLDIFLNLDLISIMALRQTCRRCFQLSKIPALWLRTAKWITTLHPNILATLGKPITSYSLEEVEALVTQAVRVERGWSRACASPPQPSEFSPKPGWASALFPGGRWFITGTVDGSGRVLYYDLENPAFGGQTLFTFSGLNGADVRELKLQTAQTSGEPLFELAVVFGTSSIDCLPPGLSSHLQYTMDVYQDPACRKRSLSLAHERIARLSSHRTGATILSLYRLNQPMPAGPDVLILSIKPEGIQGVCLVPDQRILACFDTRIGLYSQPTVPWRGSGPLPQGLSKAKPQWIYSLKTTYEGWLMGMSIPWYDGEGILSISIFDSVGLHILSLKNDGMSALHVQTIQSRRQSPKAQICLGTFRGLQSTWKSEGLERMTIMDASRLAALRYFAGVEDGTLSRKTTHVVVDLNPCPTTDPSTNEYCHVDEQSGIILFPIRGWSPVYHVLHLAE